ncbi:hypothetical protein K7X08_024286 [Anisodus acutangulus]|uniref:Uncharacterized protein n=1 Tax=Anisodus acutangulus TaxID=402998 RepID=A0A9Q1M8J6_9SOLA|nr:hypothetical protein K7X08_024286 [Anisodus acutangulus]
MKDALRPVMTAMVSSELSKHADADVKVSAVSCISELSTITAPEQPYDDGLMKMPRPVRVMLLHLECDALAIL